MLTAVPSTLPLNCPRSLRALLGQVASIAGQACSVVIEIGGNDLLGDMPAAEFECTLDRLLAQLSGTHHYIVMFELPLPLLSHPYGRAQRRLAAKHAVTLIPKKVLASVLATPGCTTDGLHLSNAGHYLLARMVMSFMPGSKAGPQFDH